MAVVLLILVTVVCAALVVRTWRQARVIQRARDELATMRRDCDDRVARRVADSERLARLRRFLPSAVAEAVLASGGEDRLDRPRRREVGVFACNLRAFGPFAASSSPEDVHCVLQEYFDVLGRHLARHGATVSGFTGDGLIAFFNDPLPCDEPVLRALVMATEIQQSMETLLNRWRPRGYDLGLGVGIALGFADIGMVGFDGRHEYSAVGGVVSLATHLCDEARPGEILVDERAHAAVQRAVRVEDSALISLKGLREPVLAISARLRAEADVVSF